MPRRSRKFRRPRARAARLRRALRWFGQAPAWVQTIIAASFVFGTWFAVNGVYQVVRKPSELFFPVSGALYKTPSETWAQYGPLFRAHSTSVMSAELLAAIAQVEGSGNPLVRTYWRWSLTPQPFEVYRPASSAVGMYQITDGAFQEARRYCIHRHAVVEEGRWYDPRSCWFNALYTRVVPSHAIELTSAYLHRQVMLTLARRRIDEATLEQQQNLAAVIHLCGPGAGDAYVARGFRLADGSFCGDHSAARYLARVNRMKRLFSCLATGAPCGRR